MKLLAASVFMILTVESCSGNGHLRQVPSLEECQSTWGTCYEVTPEGSLVFHPRAR